MSLIDKIFDFSYHAIFLNHHYDFLVVENIYIVYSNEYTFYIVFLNSNDNSLYCFQYPNTEHLSKKMLFHKLFPYNTLYQFKDFLNKCSFSFSEPVLQSTTLNFVFSHYNHLLPFSRETIKSIVSSKEIGDFKLSDKIIDLYNRHSSLFLNKLTLNRKLPSYSLILNNSSDQFCDIIDFNYNKYAYRNNFLNSFYFYSANNNSLITNIFFSPTCLFYKIYSEFDDSNLLVINKNIDYNSFLEVFNYCILNKVKPPVDFPYNIVFNIDEFSNNITSEYIGFIKLFCFLTSSYLPYKFDFSVNHQSNQCVFSFVSMPKTFTADKFLEFVATLNDALNIYQDKTLLDIKFTHVTQHNTIVPNLHCKSTGNGLLSTKVNYSASIHSICFEIKYETLDKFLTNIISFFNLSDHFSFLNLDTSEIYQNVEQPF